MKKGIDVSLWDPDMDWSKYTWDFAFIKVSEGTVIDPRFDVHWLKAKRQTLRGPYHFFRAFVDPRRAVEKFVEYLGDDVGELPPVLDLEATNSVEIKTVVSRALTWLIECEHVMGIRPIVYAGLDFITNVLKLYLYPDFAKYDLWLAVYQYDKIYKEYTVEDRTRKIKSILENPSLLRIPSIPKPFVRMPYFQWTAKGNPFDVPGYYTGIGHKEAVDFNFQLEETNNPQPKADITINIRSVQ